MSSNQDDAETDRRRPFEGAEEYAQRLFRRMNEQLERHAATTESRVEFILAQQAQFTTDMQALREAHERADERWARTEGSIRDLLAIVELQAGEVKEMSAAVRAVDERARHTDERLDALIGVVEQMVSGRNGQG